jgi:hypothetical protein
MKLSEKGLRQLIKEELALVADVNEEEEGSEVTRDAIESNLHDETIVRFFEGLCVDETLEEQDAPGKTTGADAFKASIEKGKEMRSGTGVTDKERSIIGLIRDKLISAARNTAIDTNPVVKRALTLMVGALEKHTKDVEAGAEQGATPAVQEEIISKVVEEILKKKQ